MTKIMYFWGLLITGDVDPEGGRRSEDMYSHPPAKDRSEPSIFQHRPAGDSASVCYLVTSRTLKAERVGFEPTTEYYPDTRFPIV
ncbi:MAG: hypothetical protein WA996_26125 [Candidatus Promineifilaceae bacterium]